MPCFNIDPETLIKIPGPVWVYWKDEHSNLLGCNDLMAEELNLASRHHIYGKSDYDFFSDKNQVDHLISCDTSVISSGKTQQFKDILTLPNLRKEFNCIKSPWINSEGKTIGVVGISYYENHTITKQYYDSYTAFKEAKLSHREKEVLYHIVRGKTAKLTAKLMLLSHRTIEQHIANIKTKLNVNTKTELIEKMIDYII